MALDSDSEREFKIVGTRVLRPDGIDKVTGKALFGADTSAPGMLHGRILRSPHAHARIRSIDTAAALALVDRAISAAAASALPALKAQRKAVLEMRSGVKGAGFVNRAI